MPFQNSVQNIRFWSIDSETNGPQDPFAHLFTSQPQYLYSNYIFPALICSFSFVSLVVPLSKHLPIQKHKNPPFPHSTFGLCPLEQTAYQVIHSVNILRFCIYVLFLSHSFYKYPKPIILNYVTTTFNKEFFDFLFWSLPIHSPSWNQSFFFFFFLVKDRLDYDITNAQISCEFFLFTADSLQQSDNLYRSAKLLSLAHLLSSYSVL